MKNIYILLTRSRTIVSRLVHLSTGDFYTHASLAWDDALTTLCSFARRYTSLPLPAGLVREELCGGYYDLHRYLPCALLRLSVDDETHRLLRQQIEEMLADASRYRYSVAGLICCRAGREIERDGRFFCSQFVAGMLEKCGAAVLPKPASLMRPEDLLDLPGVRMVHTGRLCDLMHPSLTNVCTGNLSLTPACGEPPLAQRFAADRVCSRIASRQAGPAAASLRGLNHAPLSPLIQGTEVLCFFPILCFL